MAVFRRSRINAARRSRLSRCWTIPVAAVCVSSLSGCGLWQRAAAPEQAAQAEEIVAVETTTAEAGSVDESLAYTGTTEPFQQVMMRSRVDGQVTLMTVDVGDPVATGDALARLDADLLTVAANQAEAELRARQSEVAQARAAVSDAQTALERARVELQQAQTDADRLMRLAADGAVSAQDAELAQVAANTAQQILRSAEEQIRTRQEAVNAAEGRVSAQQAVLDQTREQLSYAILRSPLSGVVLDRLVETGDYVESGDEVMQVGDLSQIKVMIEVSDRDLAKVSVGQPVEVRLDAFPDQLLSGRGSRIAPVADPTSRLIPVEISVPNETGRIGSGLLARVSLQDRAGDRVVTVPNDALEIQTDAPPPTVFIIARTDGQEATVEARNVTLGRQTSDLTEITAGLRPGETFVVRSEGDLSDGATVRLSILSEVETAE